jgi:hypothetical protein
MFVEVAPPTAIMSFNGFSAFKLEKTPLLRL